MVTTGTGQSAALANPLPKTSLPHLIGSSKLTEQSTLKLDLKTCTDYASFLSRRLRAHYDAEYPFGPDYSIDFRPINEIGENAFSGQIILTCQDRHLGEHGKDRPDKVFEECANAIDEIFEGHPCTFGVVDWDWSETKTDQTVTIDYILYINTYSQDIDPMFVNAKEVQCPHCDGQGEIMVKDWNTFVPETCPKCKGNGKLFIRVDNPEENATLKDAVKAGRFRRRRSINLD